MEEERAEREAGSSWSPRGHRHLGSSLGNKERQERDLSRVFPRWEGAGMVRTELVSFGEEREHRSHGNPLERSRSAGRQQA